jgi:uncharacterized membrane protein YgcG
MRLGRLLALAGVAVLGVTGASAVASLGTRDSTAYAQAFESIPGYRVRIQINADGSLTIHEHIDYDFGSTPRHGIFRDIPVRFDYLKKPDTDRVYELDVLSVKASEGAPAQYETEELSEDGVGYERIKIGDPDRTITGEHTYDITYRVEGALNAFEDHDELSWNSIGHQWALIIDHTTTRVVAPTAITQIACFQGSTGAMLPCEVASADGSVARFAQSDLFPFQGVTVVVAIPKGAVPEPKPILEERQTIGRAFTLDATTGGITAGLLLLLVGGFALLFFRKARDRRYQGSSVDQAFGGADAKEERAPLFDHTETPVEFVPPDDLRPGQVGTLVDFKANPLDVTATIVDLGVRKHLVIDEIETDSKWKRNDWKLTKLEKSDEKLKDYERELLDALFEDGDEVELSDLKYKFATRMGKVQKALLDDAMNQGWFTKRPDGSALGVGCLGLVVLLVGIGITIALAAFTRAALLGVPVILLGLVMMFSARFAPSRTAKGSAVLRRVNGFRRFIDESEKERARFAERKNLFSEYLPYAIVFGATEKWARAFEGLAGEPTDTTYWYRSATPFQYMVFSDAVEGFTMSTSGTLTSTPPSTSGSSGFSGGGGGGFSGGGGGGGGGGSW